MNTITCKIMLVLKAIGSGKNTELSTTEISEFWCQLEISDAFNGEY